MIEKEIYSPPTKEDEAIMIMAKNQIEIDEYLLAKEFEEALEEAKEKAGKHMVDYMRWVCHWRGLGNHMDPGEELPETKGKLDLLSYDFLHKRNMLFGTPEYVIDKIHELKSELNLQNLHVWSNFPGIKHEDCMKSIKLFTEKVMPHFKDDIDTEVKKVS